jgi:hypothetical protein
MPSSFSYHRTESHITKEFCNLINTISIPHLIIGGKNINIITIIWSLLRDDNFSFLLTSIQEKALHTILLHGDITLLHNKDLKEHLDITNYIVIKSTINTFYNSLIKIAVYYGEHKQFINKETVLKVLKQKEISLPLLLRQEQFMFKIQKIIMLPAIILQGKSEQDRPQISFVDKRQLDDFLLFLNTTTLDISQKSTKDSLFSFTQQSNRRR